MQCQTFHVFLGSSQDFAFQICAQVTWYVPNQGICSTYSAPFPFSALLTPPPKAPTLNHVYKGELATCGGELL